MKSIAVTVAAFAAINYAVPASLTELSLLVNKDDKEKADAQILNAANQYYLQQNLIRVRNEIAKELAKKYEVAPKLYIGKVEVTATLDKDGVINGYVSATDSKKKFKADSKPTKEKALEFIKRVVKEKEISEADAKSIVQEIANANPFSAEQKRVRGSVTSKPVGKKWVKLATNIIAAGNGPAAAAKLAADSGQAPVDTTAADGAKRLALALSDQAKRALAVITATQGEFAGTDEQTLVVGGATDKTV